MTTCECICKAAGHQGGTIHDWNAKVSAVLGQRIDLVYATSDDLADCARRILDTCENTPSSLVLARIISRASILKAGLQTTTL